MKWVDTTPAEAEGQFEFLLERCVAAVVFRVEKTMPAWSDFWDRADQYHAEMARVARRKVGFVKAGTLLRYWLFGEASARVMGDSVRLTGRPRVLTHRGLGSVESTVICDSDIQGSENIDVFQWLFERLDERPDPLLASFGLHPHVRECRLETEEAEPLLYLADYLAGLYQSCPDELEDLSEAVRANEKVAVVDYRFDIAYESIFGSSGVGRELWPK